MANKAKKRVISELTAADESGNANSPGQKANKKFIKAKVNSAQIGHKAKEAQAKSSQGKNVNAPGESKKLKMQNAQNGKSILQVSEAKPDQKDVKLSLDKVSSEGVIMSKKLKKLKEKQLKRENRKQLRQEHGQYKIEGTMDLETMRQKIEEIKNRENITKTAKRKLRILKKKLAIAEGSVPLSQPPNIKAGDEGTAMPTKTQRKKLKKQKRLENAAQNQIDSANISTDQKSIKKKPVSEKITVKQEIKTEFGNKKIKLESNNINLNLKKPETGKNLQKLNQKIKIKDEEDDDSEDHSLEEAKPEAESTSEEVEEDDEEKEADDDEEDVENEDEEQDDEDEEEEDEGVEQEDEEDEESDDDEEDQKIVKHDIASKKFTDTKVKKEPKQNTPKIPNQENGDKKKRYVLFVGNIPFKATVDDLKKHFLQKVSEVISVRIPTNKGTKKPRGFAYVEVSNNVDYEKGLALHHSTLQGFKINVEYTQTGSKNIKNKPEVVAKNKKLHAIRKAGKLAGSKKENQKRSFRRNFKKNQPT